jgi:hypothetical protein
MIDALTAGEDQRYYRHKGVDYVGIVRAGYLNWQAREVNQGASTITQQLARNAYNLREEAKRRGESGIERKLVEAFLAHALANDFAPEVMAYLKVRPDKLDDTQAQVANDHLVGASPRGWEDVSNVLKSNVSQQAKRTFVQGRIGAANAAEFFGVLREIQAGADVMRLLAAKRGAETAALLPRTLDGLYGMVYGLLAASNDPAKLTRALEIVEQFPDIRGDAPLPVRESQTLAMELLMQKALEQGLEATILDSDAYRRYSDRRARESVDA